MGNIRKKCKAKERKQRANGIFDRLRRWLIKKLGGYTEQRQAVQIVQQRANVRIYRIAEEMSIEAPTESAINYERYCKDELLKRIAQDLYQSDLVLWESNVDTIRQGMNVRATVCVISANDYGY